MASFKKISLAEHTLALPRTSHFYFPAGSLSSQRNSLVDYEDEAGHASLSEDSEPLNVQVIGFEQVTPVETSRLGQGLCQGTMTQFEQSFKPEFITVTAGCILIQPTNKNKQQNSEPEFSQVLHQLDRLLDCQPPAFFNSSSQFETELLAKVKAVEHRIKRLEEVNAKLVEETNKLRGLVYRPLEAPSSVLQATLLENSQTYKPTPAKTIPWKGRTQTLNAVSLESTVSYRARRLSTDFEELRKKYGRIHH